MARHSQDFQERDFADMATPKCCQNLNPYVKRVAKLRENMAYARRLSLCDFLKLVMKSHRRLNKIIVPEGWVADPVLSMRDAIKVFIIEIIGETEFNRAYFCDETHSDDDDNLYPGDDKPGPSKGFAHQVHRKSDAERFWRHLHMQNCTDSESDEEVEKEEEEVI